MEQPSGPQQAIFRQIVQHAGNLASVLEAQFQCCQTEPEEFCQECFDIEVIGDVERLPNDVECPLSFGVHEIGVPDGTGALSVLLWHEEGLVTGVEVNSVTHPQAALTDLKVVDQYLSIVLGMIRARIRSSKQELDIEVSQSYWDDFRSELGQR